MSLSASRLVTFGCSYTFGDGLPDYTYNHPSKYAWTSHLAKRLYIPYVNNGKSGSGNLEILWKVLNFKFQQDDLVVILWSHFNRDCIFGPHVIENIDFSSNSSIVNGWLKTHTEYDNNIRNWIYIHHANSMLKSKNITSFHLLFDLRNIGGDKLIPPENLFIDNILNIKFTFEDYGSDNGHPGVKSHQLFADNLYIALSTQ